MKEKDFNQILKSSVDDFETNNMASFNQEKVWKNIKVKKRIIWFDILKVASVIFLFISVGLWFNSSSPIQSDKKQAKKNIIEPQLNPIENTLIEKPVVQTQPTKDLYIKNKSSLRNELAIIKSEITILETETLEHELLINLITEVKPLIKEPVEPAPEIIYAVEFKRGKPRDNLETKQKANVPMISFKRFRKSLIELDTNTVIANSNLSTNNHKLKF